MLRVAAISIFLLVAGSLNGQVVVSRRAYAAHGRTWRQLWISNPESTQFRQLTVSSRDHTKPLCSRDGRSIYFISDRDPARSLNAYAGGDGREVWAFDRTTGRERLIWRTTNDDGLDLSGTTAGGALLVRLGTELRTLLHDPWRIEKLDSAAVSPDGRMLAAVIARSIDQEGQSHDSQLFLVDSVSGKSRSRLGNYQGPAWSPDGKRIAAMAGDGLAILDVPTGKEVFRAPWPKTDSPPEDLVWSPDGKSLLAGLYGEAGGSGDPQRDYFLLNLAGGTWTPALTAQKILWRHEGTVLYLRPIALTPLVPGSTHSVWTAQLATFDLSAHVGTPLTTGLLLNDDLCSCVSTRSSSRSR